MLESNYRAVGLILCDDFKAAADRIASLEAELAEARVQPPAQGRVKPLEWEEMTATKAMRSICIVGTYCIAHYRGGVFRWWRVGVGTKHDASGVLEAQAAAQADYESRVLSCLEPRPVTVQEAARVLLDHLRIQPVSDAIEGNVSISRFAAALRAIAQEEEG
jgi:hypothetical protein